MADFDVAKNGDMEVTETITVDFPVYGKHGIFRFWDIVDDNDPHARRMPEDISVTRDGSDEPFEMSGEDHGRQRVAKIGDAEHHARPRRAHLRDQLPHGRRARREQQDDHRRRPRHDVLLAAHPARVAAEHRPVDAHRAPARRRPRTT